MSWCAWGLAWQLLPTLESLGLRCPTYYNPADFVVKLSSRRLADDEVGR